MNQESILILVGMLAIAFGIAAGNFISSHLFFRRSYNSVNAIELIKLNKPEEWNEVKIQNPNWIPTIDKESFASLNIPLINFQKSILSNVNFKSAMLDGADFSYATLKGVDFTYASLSGANFDYAEFLDVTWENANTTNASFVGVKGQTENINIREAYKGDDRRNIKILIDDIRSHPSILEKISPKEFEQLTSQIFQLLGYKIVSKDDLADQRFDFIATYEDLVSGKQKYVVEVKKTPIDYKVGFSSVRVLYTQLLNSDADQAILVTSTEATESAKDFAQKTGIRIINREDLLDMMEKIKKPRSTKRTPV